MQQLKDEATEDPSEFRTEVIDCYLNDTANRLQTIRTTVAQGEAAGLHQAAHTLKSTSATLGAMTFSKLCTELEAMGRAGTTEGAFDKVSHLEDEYKRVKAALEIERQRYQP